MTAVASVAAAEIPSSAYRSRKQGRRHHQRPRLFQVKLGDYMLMHTLGEGEYGKVKLGVHCSTRQEVAVKLIRKDTVDLSEIRRSRVEREIHALRTLKHPNIVKLIDVVETDKYIGIILEYASGGELFEYILAHRMMEEDDARWLFAQLISSVNYMHHQKVVHRDLKLENLLLDGNRNLRITDFGFANGFHRDINLMATSCGSPCYAAPELVVTEGAYAGPLADIWSCGVILYAMLCGHLPFDDDPNNPDGHNISRLYQYILTTPLTFPMHISPGARDLLRQMLTIDPSKRCSLDIIIQHHWLAPHADMLNKPDAALETEAMEMLESITPPPLPLTRRHDMDVIIGGGRGDGLDGKSRPRTVSASTVRRRKRILSLFTGATRDTNMQPQPATSPPSSVPATLRSRLVASWHRSKATSRTMDRDPLGVDNEAIAIHREAALHALSPERPRPRHYSTIGRNAARKLAVAAGQRPGNESCSSHPAQQPAATTNTGRNKVIEWIRRKRPGRGTVTRPPATTSDIPADEERASPIDPATTTASPKQPAPAEYSLRVHYGAVDKAALTSCSPVQVVIQVRQILHALGIECSHHHHHHHHHQPADGGFKIKCTRRAKRVVYAAPASITLFPNPGRLSATSSIHCADTDDDDTSASLFTLTSSVTTANTSDTAGGGCDQALHHRQLHHQGHPIYGDPAVDPGEEIRFVVEVCRLPDSQTKIIHVRRLRGNVWAFKFIYTKFMDLLAMTGTAGTAKSNNSKSTESLLSLA